MQTKSFVMLAGLLVTLGGLAAAGFAPVARADSSPSPAQIVTIGIPARNAQVAKKWWNYSGPPRANVLLPAGYDPHKRYPLLILLNGLATNYNWYAEYGIADQFDDFGAIVVMPEGGSGWYTDWWNSGKRGGPSWESYILNDVIPTILDRYPILPQRRYHTIAGTSMGGLGAVYLGGRLPGFFGSVASLSGFVDPEYFGLITDLVVGITSLAPFMGNHHLFPVWGHPNGFYFKGHNPKRLVNNLQHTRLFVRTGTGALSKTQLRNPPYAGGLQPLQGVVEESLIIYPMNLLYHRALSVAGIDVTYQVRPGGHDLPDFRNSFRALIKWGPFKPVTTHPAGWVNDTVAQSGQLWDIGYQFAEPPKRIVRFRRSGAMLSIGAAGSDVTLTTRGGCVIHTPTPASIPIPHRNCKAAGTSLDSGARQPPGQVTQRDSARATSHVIDR